MTTYENLCQTANISPITQPFSLQQFSTLQAIAEKTPSERITAALQVFLELLIAETEPVQKVDKILLDHLIGQVDLKIEQELDKILLNPEFQQLESLWTSLKYLVDRTDFRANTKIEILDIDKETLREDFNDAQDITQSGLYQHIYVQEYDTPGGEPFSAIISDYMFDASSPDLQLLSNIAQIASTTHCPFIGNVGAKFFHKESLEDVMRIHDLPAYMDRAEYVGWNAFRQTEAARYIGLTLPQFLLRLPHTTNYLWGKSSFAFATTLTRSFKEHGWTVNIRGPESGGKIENLVLHHYDIGRGLQTKIPSEILIPETRELEFAQLGFIPLSYYKNNNFACFFSANSTQKPAIYETPEATANSRINARLPYIFLSSRLGHYLKVLQRENIGSPKDKEELERELNRWLNTLITHMNNPGPELMATHPLREGKVEVLTIPDNPGYYRVNLYVMPHFQVEGIDVRLSLIAQLPTKEH
ncbi:MAG: type VI secretion system contractile sheath large subunit [Gammaproteobacteria bacterium]|nr:type VI secretion system contractile sheath large subunit [Gammaproteobacteria bacterium]